MRTVQQREETREKEREKLCTVVYYIHCVQCTGPHMEQFSLLLAQRAQVLTCGASGGLGPPGYTIDHTPHFKQATKKEIRRIFWF